MLAFTSTKIPPSGIKNSAFEPDARKIRPSVTKSSAIWPAARKIRPSVTKSSAFWPKARKVRPSVTKSSNSGPEYQFGKKTLQTDTKTARIVSNLSEIIAV